jgi:hypothetical protein
VARGDQAGLVVISDAPERPDKIPRLDLLGHTQFSTTMQIEPTAQAFVRPGRRDLPDSRVDGGFEFGQPTEIVEIPVSWSWDDFPQFEFVSAPTFMANALASPSKVFEIWSADIDYMVHRVPDGVFDLTMHPQVMGRGHRIMLLEQVIEHCRKYPSLRFARAGEVAEEYRARMGGVTRS